MNQAGYGPFAGAALAGEQHRDVDRGKFANLVMKRMHGRHGAKDHVSRRQQWFSQNGLGMQGGLSASLKRMWSSHCPLLMHIECQLQRSHQVPEPQTNKCFFDEQPIELLSKRPEAVQTCHSGSNVPPYRDQGLPV